MSERKNATRIVKKVREEYQLEVKSFEIRMTAGINPALAPGSPYVFLDDPLYISSLRLDIITTCLAPVRFKGDDLTVLMNTLTKTDWSNQCVADVQQQDEHGNPKYRKSGRDVLPDFVPPRGIGQVWRSRKVDPWKAIVALPPYVIQEFRTALSMGQAPRIFLSVLRTGQERVIQCIDYSTPGLFEH